MKNGKLEDVKKETANVEPHVEMVKFISTSEDEQEGNFEFLCCRGGYGMGGGGIGGRW
ncbi:hypothetical protein ACN4GA_02700 [Raoultella terrigena]|uniref:hypothetical protein n=1 Tax=Raoultella terrigena TaxID=577 RepID=UPI000E0149B6|nr:hypothetical protein [Raoultella terrigena]SUQ56519.1 Uncharacterised protein [Raoultella terrigena]